MEVLGDALSQKQDRLKVSKVRRSRLPQYQTGDLIRTPMWTGWYFDSEVTFRF